MKRFVIILFIISVIFLGKDKNNIVVPKNSIRFRIIANSNNQQDQELKNKIKDDIFTNYIEKLNMNSYNTTEKSILETTETLKNIINKYNINYDISYDKNYFPNKTYNGIKYLEGDYQSLVITLGSGTGKNWWCILFPPLCNLETNKEKYSDVEYRSYIKDIINKS